MIYVATIIMPMVKCRKLFTNVPNSGSFCVNSDIVQYKERIFNYVYYFLSRSLIIFLVMQIIGCYDIKYNITTEVKMHKKQPISVDGSS